MKTLILPALCTLLAIASMASTTKYRVKVTADPGTNFSKVRTYSWLPSHIAADEDVHLKIVAAIDRELQAVGVLEAPSGFADVVVTYAAYSRTDVNTSAKEVEKYVHPTYPVGILVVSLLEPKTLREVLELRVAAPFTRPERGAVINETVQAMFRRYPYRVHG